MRPPEALPAPPRAAGGWGRGGRLLGGVAWGLPAAVVVCWPEPRASATTVASTQSNCTRPLHVRKTQPRRVGRARAGLTRAGLTKRVAQAPTSA